MSDEIETHQPIHGHLAEARELLSAAERFTADDYDHWAILSVISASEALDILSEISPPHPALAESHEPAPLSAILPAVLSALERASAEAGDSVQLHLGIARAGRVLAGHARAAEASQ